MKNPKENLPIALYKGNIHPPYGVVWMSEKVEQSTGFSYNVFKHDSSFWETRVHPEDKERVISEFSLLLTGQRESLETEYRWLHKDGTYHRYVDHGVLVKDEAGKPYEILGAWVDISLYAAAEQTIKENEEHYQKLVELCPYAIFVQADGKFAFMNYAAVRLFGANEPEEIVGKPIVNFFHPDHHAKISERMQVLTEGRKHVPLIEYKIVTLDGEVKTVEITATPFTYQGRPASQGVMVDITKHKQTEDYLNSQREELEQLNRILLRRQLDSRPDSMGKAEACNSSFDNEKSVLYIGTKEVKIQKFSKQYYLLQIVFKDAECAAKDWQLSEISEFMDMEAKFEWKRLYNIADAIRKNVAIETGIRDFFMLTTQSVKINPKYLKSS